MKALEQLKPILVNAFRSTRSFIITVSRYCNMNIWFSLQVPYEILNKKFRVAQKNIDREVTRVQSSAEELEKCLLGSPSSSEVSTVLGGMVEKLTILKRKVANMPLNELPSYESVGIFILTL